MSCLYIWVNVCGIVNNNYHNSSDGDESHADLTHLILDILRMSRGGVSPWFSPEEQQEPRPETHQQQGNTISTLSFIL